MKPLKSKKKRHVKKRVKKQHDAVMKIADELLERPDIAAIMKRLKEQGD